MYWAFLWYILVWRFDYAYGWPPKAVLLTGITYVVAPISLVAATVFGNRGRAHEVAALLAFSWVTILFLLVRLHS